MEVPQTNQGNQYVVMFQDFFTKWPMVFLVPDQKAVCIVRLFAKELVPVFGVPEALLTDCGTGLLAHLMKDVCRLLGTKKLNTTAYHMSGHTILVVNNTVYMYCNLFHLGSEFTLVHSLELLATLLPEEGSSRSYSTLW